MTKVLSDPLLYFLLVGIALFFLADVMKDEGPARVVVTDAERSRLAAQWQGQMGRPPTPSEIEGLVDQWVREEIYYREALAMGLDEGDVIIRRRLAQKLTFLTEDVAVAGTPEDAALLAFYARHAERYGEPARFTFRHLYFSEERGDAESAAREALKLAVDGSVPDGDPFMMQPSYVKRSQREIADLFGSEFATTVGQLPEGGWQGPVRSAYGWHLVEVERSLPARQMGFDEVAEQVAIDYLQDQRRAANEAYYGLLRERYQVVRP